MLQQKPFSELPGVIRGCCCPSMEICRLISISPIAPRSPEGFEVELYTGLFIKIGGTFINSVKTKWNIDERNLWGHSAYRAVLECNSEKSKQTPWYANLLPVQPRHVTNAVRTQQKPQLENARAEIQQT